MIDKETDRAEFVATVQRVQVCVKDERLADARDILISAVERWPHISMLWGYLGCVWSELGSDEQSLDCWRKARDLKPDSESSSLCLIELLWKPGDRLEFIDEVTRFLSIQDSKEHRDWAISLIKYLEKSGDDSKTLAYAIDQFADFNLETD